MDVDRAARVHTRLHTFARLQPTSWQRTQQRQFLGQPVPTTRVELGEQATQELLIRHPRGEVPTAAQHQGLVQRPLEPVMTLFHVPILVGMTRLDRLPLQAVVPQQRLVTLSERRRTFRPRRDRRGQPVGAVQLGRAAQFPQGVPQALAEGFS